MKTNSLIPLALLALLTFTGCNKKQSDERTPPAVAQETPALAPSRGINGTPPFEGARKTTFQDVTSQLDPGGSLFLYLSTEKWLSQLSTNISAIRQVVMSLPGQPMQKRDEMDRVFNLLTSLVQNSGVQDVTGVGVSGAQVGPELYRNKLILHHASGAGRGFLWSLFGRAPHKLDALDMLPANTALAGFVDLDIAQLWQVLEEQLKQSGIPEAVEAAQSFPQMFEKQTQIQWKPLLSSLGGEIGILLTLDETHPLSIPAGREKVMKIPTPGLLLALKSKNDYLYQQIAAKFEGNPKTVTSEEDGLKITSMPLPLPLPIPLKLTIASSADYFYFTTSPDLLRTLQAVRKGKSPGLKSSPEFQTLAKFVPAEGNQFVYVSKSLGQAVEEIQQQAMSESGLPNEQLGVLRRLLGSEGPTFSLLTGGHTATGWQTSRVGNKDSSSAVMLAPVAGVAIGAGMLLPALAKAKGKAQTINSVNQMKQLGLAARMYSNDHKDKFPNAQSWCDDIKEYVGNPKVYKAANDSGPGECSFAYNEKLSGLDESKIDPQTVLFFEAEGGWNRSGGRELMLKSPRSGNNYVVGLADGSVQQMSANKIKSLRWDP